MPMRVEPVAFPDRPARARFVADRFRDALRGRILDVGCDRRALQQFLPDDVDYTGIDAGGDPTLRIDLDASPRLPFEDDHFDCVVCTEVLEHLDKLHAVFDEMVRVCRGRLIISLPNCWLAVRLKLPRGRGTPKFYGLPPRPPDDRHRWFFNVSDVVGFFEAQQRTRPVRVEQQFVVEKPRHFADRAMRRVTHLTQARYLNRYADSVWTVLVKRPAAGPAGDQAVSAGAAGPRAAIMGSERGRS